MAVEGRGFGSCLYDGWVDEHLPEAAGAVLRVDALRREVEAEDGGQRVADAPAEGCCYSFGGF
jgi:hypothetical protein